MALRALGGLLLGLLVCSCGTSDSSRPPTESQNPPLPGEGGNLPPSFALEARVTFLEDATSPALEVTHVSAGSSEEDAAQTVAFAATSSNRAVISSAQVVGSGVGRTLQFVLVPNASGEATVNVTATDSAGASTSHAVVVTVTPVNDPPTLAQPSAQNVTGASPVVVNLTGIGPGGGADEAGQPVTLQATTANTSLVTALNVSAVSNGSATLTFMPHATNSGVTTITVTALDGQAQNSTTQVRFEVRVNDSVGNLAPYFTLASTATFAEDAAGPTVAVTGVGAGSVEENATQTVAFTATSSNTSVVASAQVVGTGGTRTLALVLVPDASGSATVTVTGTDSGTPPIAVTRTLNVVVTPVNDPPTMAQPARQDVTGSTPVVVPLTGIGPGGGADEAGQTVTLQATTSNPALVTALSVSAVSNGTASVSFTPHPTDRGVASISITASDGQSDNAATAVTFDVLVNAPLPALANVSTIPASVSGCVSISFDAIESTSAPITVRLEVDSGSGYRDATWQGAPSQPLTSSPSGVPHTLVWRSSRDVNGAFANNVRVRLTPQRSSFAGTPVERTGLAVDNRLAFATAVGYPGGNGPFQAVLGDINGDGRLDVVTAESYSNSVAILLGQSGGGFGAPTSIPTAPGTTCTTGSVGQPVKPFSVTLSDQNGDGRLDIIAIHQNCNSLGVLLSNGPGTFEPFVTYPLGSIPLFASTADVNEDGQTDLLVVNFGSANVSLLLGRSDGTFSVQAPILVGSEPNKIAVADFDNDGHADFVTANFSDNQVAIVRGRGDGTFHAPQAYFAGVRPRNLAVGDFNADGRTDLVVALPGASDNQTAISVLMQNTNGTFSEPTIYTVGVHPRSAAVGDLNGDGRLDIAIGNVNSGTVSLLVGRGDGTFRDAVNLLVGDGPHSVAFQDLNGDGRLDLLTADSFSNRVSVVSNQTPVCGP